MYYIEILPNELIEILLSKMNYDQFIMFSSIFNISKINIITIYKYKFGIYNPDILNNIFNSRNNYIKYINILKGVENDIKSSQFVDMSDQFHYIILSLNISYYSWSTVEKLKEIKQNIYAKSIIDGYIKSGEVYNEEIYTANKLPEIIFTNETDAISIESNLYINKNDKNSVYKSFILFANKNLGYGLHHNTICFKMENRKRDFFEKVLTEVLYIDTDYNADFTNIYKIARFNTINGKNSVIYYDYTIMNDDESCGEL
jgi:hypothetical protein